LRALVEAGIIAAAALDARDDLNLAAASTQRLGVLSSGMWRALSRELATAAERLDRSTIERLDDIERRARSLQVDADEVVAVGFAAAHLAEHRQTVEALVKPGQDARHLLGPDMLFGFSLEAPAVEEDDDDDGDEPNPGAVDVALLLWPAPLTPVMVSIVPSLLPGAVEGALVPEKVSLGFALTASPLLVAALTTATKLSGDQVDQALIALATACWSAHHLDELPPDDEDVEDSDAAADLEADQGPPGV